MFFAARLVRILNIKDEKHVLYCESNQE